MAEPTSSPSEPTGEASSQHWPEVPSFEVVPMQAPPGHPPETLLGKRLAMARLHYDLNIEALARLTKAYDEQEGRGISPATLARYAHLSPDHLQEARRLNPLAQMQSIER